MSQAELFTSDEPESLAYLNLVLIRGVGSKESKVTDCVRVIFVANSFQYNSPSYMPHTSALARLREHLTLQSPVHTSCQAPYSKPDHHLYPSSHACAYRQQSSSICPTWTENSVLHPWSNGSLIDLIRSGRAPLASSPPGSNGTRAWFVGSIAETVQRSLGQDMEGS